MTEFTDQSNLPKLSDQELRHESNACLRELQQLTEKRGLSNSEKKRLCELTALHTAHLVEGQERQKASYDQIEIEPGRKPKFGRR